MKKFKKQSRYDSHKRGQEFVKGFRGLIFNPISTYNTEVVIPGKYAEVDVTLNLGTHPLPELTDVTPLEQMKANMEVQRRVRVRTAPAPVAPIASEPVVEKKSRRKAVVALIVAGISAVGIGYALYRKGA